MSVFAKKKKYIISVFSIVVLALVLCTAAVPSGKAYAASGESIGVVDLMYLINNHPDTPKANEALQAEIEQAGKDFEVKAAGLGDKEKQELNLQRVKQVEQKRVELLKPIAEKVNMAIKQVVEAKGWAIVINKGMVAYGGVDITSEVFRIITGK
ncbi:OmpH family outer membrane protein [Sporomusa sp. KB1]|jgi:outer membrane protein|uniref:OmpH family outer membrane protein n=1 Tax=Sporomusa sp. KB1 TaxID=943346 RepID=UPI0011AA324F|nr:OmpH family outer membrane protein [Sporomusa sp. KB1]TWH45067.1 periplasmic chaperone for outer membrane proteins Skp [Sporomusa sp. KB1]